MQLQGVKRDRVFCSGTEMDTQVPKLTTEVTEAERALCERLTGADVAITRELAQAARVHRVHLLVAPSLTAAERTTEEGVRLGRELTIAAALEAWSADETRALLDA